MEDVSPSILFCIKDLNLKTSLAYLDHNYSHKYRKNMIHQTRPPSCISLSYCSDAHIPTVGNFDEWRPERVPPLAAFEPVTSSLNHFW